MLSIQLKTLKSRSSKMTRSVINTIQKNRGLKGMREHLEEVEKYHCISGVVPWMIYTSDVIAFYEKHKADINALLTELEYPLEDLYEFDRSDRLCQKLHNQNLLGWLAYEMTCEKIQQAIK